MLASFVVYVRSQGDMPSLTSTGQLLHAAFLSAVAKNDPGLAAQLHRGNIKPFTLSSLQQHPNQSDKLPPADSPDVFWFRITTLTDPLFFSIGQVLHGLLNGASLISLGDGTHFQVVKVHSGPVERLCWTGISSFEQIYNESVPEDDITLCFYSPTSFKQRDKSVPLPLPGLVFASYLQKWNAFSPLKFDRASLLAWVQDNVGIGAHRIETMMVSFDKFHIVGFVGTCRYRSLKKDAEKQRILNALADFAFYAGTGAKTTMGMGQTRRLR